jgi:hypothetical protein
VNTTARTLRSASHSISFRPNSISIGPLIAFKRSGRSNVMVATCPSRSKIT